jgi:hypothetical protein
MTLTDIIDSAVLDAATYHEAVKIVETHGFWLATEAYSPENYMLTASFSSELNDNIIVVLEWEVQYNFPASVNAFGFDEEYGYSVLV